MKKLFLTFILITTTVWAQQEKAQSNADLRFGKKVFIYRSLGNVYEYVFSKKSNGESYLSSKSEGFIKLSDEDEAEFEPTVVNLFIKIKYQLGEIKEKCKKSSFLGYLGDEVLICPTDITRIKLAKKIEKKFENLIAKAKR